jgi:hypothetical protein
MKAAEVGLLPKEVASVSHPDLPANMFLGGKGMSSALDDVTRTEENDTLPAYFFGIDGLHTEERLQGNDGIAATVIHGQHRLTTFTLSLRRWLETLCDLESSDGFSARKLRNYYLVNPEEDCEPIHGVSRNLAHYVLFCRKGANLDGGVYRVPGCKRHKT